MKIIYQLLLLVIFSSISVQVFAQAGYDVAGTVTNEKGEPLTGATVFIGGSERVMPTNDQGRFVFHHIPPGNFQLSVQMVGYTPVSRSIAIKNSAVTADIRLQTKTIDLGQVTIGNKRSWARNFKIFEREFLGESANARQCTILNPHVVNFSTKKGLLMADADDFLIIENKRLGYRIRYLVKDFGYNYVDGIVLYHGDFSFEELDGTPEQKQQWAKNRLETYQGSFMHFLRSVYANNTLENGFIARPLYGYGTIRMDTTTTDVYKVKVKDRPVKFDTLVTAIDSNFSAFRFKQLYVIYNPKKAAAFGKNTYDEKKNMVILPKATLLRLAAEAAIIDKKGSYTDYRDFFIQGYWARARVADQLPVEYKPPVPEIPSRPVATNIMLASLQKWADSIPQEKAYLQLDKPYYALGDTIWFKGYLTTGSRHQLSPISGAVYIDLIDQQNQAVKTLKLPVDSGTVAGDLILGDDVKAGSYHIRAYTQYMRNAGEDYFFNRAITIGDPIAQQKEIDKPDLQKTDIQFFPEGGNLVYGLTSRVGFKAVGVDGLGQTISGTVTDNTGNQVAQFGTLHAGMGNFLLKPEAGKTYIANIKLSDGSVKAVALPAPVNQGFVLSVYQPNKDSLLVRILASAGLIHARVNLIAHSSGEVIYSAPIGIEGAMTSVWFNKHVFPSGIAQFTIFNEKFAPLSERIAFIKNNDHMQLAVKTDKPVYKSKEHVKLELNAKTGDSVAVAANFSVAVINESKVPVDEDAESTIFSNLLLTSDIKGYVEKPNYYFTADSDQVNRALDNLMLTQGYRRFEWLSLDTIVDTKPRFPAEGLGYTIAGNVTDLQHRVLPNASVQLVSMNARITKTTFTDTNGRFKFSKLIFPDSAKFAVQARTKENTDNTIITLDSIPTLKNRLQQNAADVKSIKTNLKKAQDDGVPLNLNGQHVLRQVNIKDAKIQVKKDVVPQGMYSLPDEQSADNILTIPDPENYLTLEQYLQGRLGGVRIGTTSGGHKTFLDSRPRTDVYFNNVKNADLKNKKWDQTGRLIGLILNGRKVDTTETDEILTGSVSPDEVARIEIVRTNQAMVNYLGGPYVLILTKPASMYHKHYSPNIVNISPKGYNQVRQFYVPKYDDPNNTNLKPDLRSTIYWNPYVNTDSGGKATLDFYNADGPGTYRIVIEGINADGDLGRQVYHYKLE